MIDATFDHSRSAAVSSDRPTLRAPVILLGVILFVGGSSAYDGYLVVRTGDMIRDFERNPVGRFLIDYNNGDPTLFLRVKAAGTVLALSALSLLHRLAPPGQPGRARARRLPKRPLVLPRKPFRLATHLRTAGPPRPTVNCRDDFAVRPILADLCNPGR